MNWLGRFIDKVAPDAETGYAGAVRVNGLPVDAQRFAHAALHLGDLDLKIDLLRAGNADMVCDRNLLWQGGNGQPHGQVGLGRGGDHAAEFDPFVEMPDAHVLERGRALQRAPDRPDINHRRHRPFGDQRAGLVQGG